MTSARRSFSSARRSKFFPAQAGNLFPCVLAGGRETKGGILFPKRIPPLKPPEKGEGRPPRPPALRDWSLKKCGACGIGCLLFFVSKRFGLLLSSLPLCLRIVSLQQFPPTLDVIRLASAYRGGIAALAAVRTTGNVCTVDRSKLGCICARSAERQRVVGASQIV